MPRPTNQTILLRVFGDYLSVFWLNSYCASVASPGFVARRAKLEIMSRGTHGELQGRVQQLLDDL